MRLDWTVFWCVLGIGLSITALVHLEGLKNPAPSGMEACPIVAGGTTPSGAVFLIRECQDGTLIREYPFPEEAP